MISQKLLAVLAIGTTAMWVPIIVQCKYYKISLRKSVPIAFLLTIIGTIGTYVLYFVENNQIGGRSFYGAVFLIPVLFFVVAKLLRIAYGEILDICAPAECIMLAIMKVQCVIDGCCSGKRIYIGADGDSFVFPSQFVELVGAILILILLLYMTRNKMNRGMIYPWYLVIYGSSRFILNYFRAETSVYMLGLTAGAFWSVVAVIIGCVVLIINKTVKSKYK